MSFPTTLLKRTFATSTAMSAIKNVTVIGGGLMGSGIAQVSGTKKLWSQSKRGSNDRVSKLVFQTVIIQCCRKEVHNLNQIDR